MIINKLRGSIVLASIGRNVTEKMGRQKGNYMVSNKLCVEVRSVLASISRNMT